MAKKSIQIRYLHYNSDVITVNYDTDSVFHQESTGGLTTVYIGHKTSIIIPTANLIDINIKYEDQRFNPNE